MAQIGWNSSAFVAIAAMEAICALLVSQHVRTWLCFINKRMKYLFFPAMALCTVTLQGAPLLIFGNESACLPLFAQFKRIVLEKMRFTTEILPVVSINALRFVMLMGKWTPFSFEVKTEKFSIRYHLMD